MTSGPDDALAAHELDLVSSAAQGDEAAFDRFYERHAPAVQLLVERLLGPGPAADAVVVEAFEKTVRRLPLLGSRNSSPGLYLLSTARNGAYAALGRARPSADGGPLAALLSLPSRQRELLGLRELGLSEEAAAEVAGVDAAEVGVQVARARLRLTDQLEGTTLSSVFADERAERLLAAEVVRSGGAPLAGDLEREITAHADEDARFAAALSAVRSPSRSVGQLPPVSGASRLAATARSGAVGSARPAASGTTASRPAIPSAPPAPAPAAPSGPPAADPPRPRRADPYDATIGDEAAWGIVDDDDHEPAPPGQPAGTPAVESPGEGEWEDGAGAVSAPGSVAASGFTPLAPRDPLQPEAPARPGDPLADPFAGWDDVDWAEDEREWSAGPPAEGASPLDAPADGESAIVSVRPARTPADVVGEPTRAFDAVAAGLVDADPPERVPVPPTTQDPGDLGPPPERRSRWRMVLIWILVVLVLFAGAALAAYAYVQATQDPAPPESKVTQTTPIATTSKPPASTPRKKSSSSSSNSTKSSSSAAKSSSSGSSRSSSSSASAGSTSSGSTAGSSSTRATTPRSTGTAGGGTGGTTKTEAAKEPSVTSGGAASSGGAVRGDAGTTP